MFGMGLSSCEDDRLSESDCFDPEVPTTDVSVHVNLDDEMKLYRNITSRASSDYALRYILKSFMGAKEIGSTVSLSPDMQIKVPAGACRLAVFVEFVPKADTSKDYYFFTSQFEELLLRNRVNYQGNDDVKLAFHGVLDCMIDNKTKQLVMDASPAMGRFRLIPTDKPDYTVGRIEIKYPTDMPAAINGFNGVVCVTWGNVVFVSRAEGEDIGFDNIFAGSKEETVTVTVEIRDTDNTIRARIKNLKIPIRRGGITNVHLPFYTTLDPGDGEVGSGQGIGIDPSFEGVFDFEY